MVWQAICSCGHWTNLLVMQGTLTPDIYISECHQKLLLPLYKAHDIPSLFWPDLASVHHSRKVLDWYKRNDVQFVARDCNPPNSPEPKTIERFWEIIKRNFLKNSRHAKNLKISNKSGIKPSKSSEMLLSKPLWDDWSREGAYLARTKLKIESLTILIN